MSRQFYVQRRHPDREWLSVNCYVIAETARLLGHNVESFTVGDTEKGEITKKCVVYGGINTTQAFLRELGVPVPALINAHRVLPDFMDRKMWETTVGAIRGNEAGSYPFFIKPLEDNKLFDGYVIQNPILGLLKLKHLSEGTKILASETVNIETEYRCFVHRGELVGAKNYKGDFWLNIDYNVVHKAIAAYENPPVAYTLDFGLTTAGRTILIEVNDGYGFGLYGLDGKIALQMITDRWDEIVGNRLR